MPIIKLGPEIAEKAQIYPSLLGREVVVTHAGVTVDNVPEAVAAELRMLGVIVEDGKRSSKKEGE